jgi:hypothetical protein
MDRTGTPYQYHAASRGWTNGLVSPRPRLIAARDRRRSRRLYTFRYQRGGTPSQVLRGVLVFQRLTLPPGRTFHLLWAMSPSLLSCYRKGAFSFRMMSVIGC